jgi:hypothetical protein
MSIRLKRRSPAPQLNSASQGAQVVLDWLYAMRHPFDQQSPRWMKSLAQRMIEPGL